MALGKSLCTSIKTTVDIYTSNQIYLSLIFCVLFILVLSSNTRKPTRCAKVEVTILYLQEDNTFFTRGCHITPIWETTFNNLSLAELSQSILALNHPCKCSIRLHIIVNAKESNRANFQTFRVWTTAIEFFIPVFIEQVQPLLHSFINYKTTADYSTKKDPSLLDKRLNGLLNNLLSRSSRLLLGIRTIHHRHLYQGTTVCHTPTNSRG